jgi:hypothetical protein
VNPIRSVNNVRRFLSLCTGESSVPKARLFAGLKSHQAPTRPIVPNFPSHVTSGEPVRSAGHPLQTLTTFYRRNWATGTSSSTTSAHRPMPLSFAAICGTFC